jgi:hypothetical protein
VFHVRCSAIKSVLYELQFTIYNFLNVIVPETYKYRFLNCFYEKGEEAPGVVRKEFPKAASIHINRFATPAGSFMKKYAKIF